MTDQEEMSFNSGEMFNDLVPPQISSLADLVPLAPEEPLPHCEVAMTDGPLKRLIDGNFLQYASYVIRDRAIPELNDGLKPVQRRILFSLHKNDDGKFIKVANIVGYSMQFHPHGDASIGEALVNLTNKQYLIEGQGNFGNLLTGDPAAASRYIECRLTELARNEVFNDDLTDFVPSYDGRKEEPVCLPVKIPLLLMLGAEGIAVGISTRILPHNFTELIEAQIALLNKEKFELVPDFFHGGIMDASEYDNGRGHVRVRASIEKKDDKTLVIKEIPFGTTTDSLIASIEDAARKGKIKVKSINDFTSERVEVEIILQEEEGADRAVEALYAFSLCQVQLSSRIVVISGNKPVELTVEDVLKHNTDRLLHILRKELLLEQKRLNDDFHRKTLIEMFIENKIYKQIEECKTPEEVEKVVLDGLAPFTSRLIRPVSGKDLEMLLEIPIRRISQFDLNKNRAELDKVKTLLAEVAEKLSSVKLHVVRYLRNLIKKYGADYPRRTKVETFAAVEIREITATELTIGYQRDKGYLGSGIKGEVLLQCSSYDKIMIFWKDGRYKVVQPVEKLFVDDDVIYCGVAERGRVLTAVYIEDFFAYAKRFTLGGTILNKEYRCIPKGSEILMFSDRKPEFLYVRYVLDAAQKIQQQEFDTRKLLVRDPKTRGIMMTSKKIVSIQGIRPGDWNPELNGPRGVFMEIGIPHLRDD